MGNGMYINQKVILACVLLWATTASALNVNDLMHPPEAHQQLVTSHSEAVDHFKPKPYEIESERDAPNPHQAVMPKPMPMSMPS